MVTQPNKINTNTIYIVVTGHALRYAYRKKVGHDIKTYIGEVFLPKDTMSHGMLDRPVSFVDTVKALVRQNKWRGRPLVFSVVDDTVYQDALLIPSHVNTFEAVDYIQTTLGTTVDVPLPDPAIAAHVLDYQENQTDIRFYAYPSEKVNLLKKAFKDAGLRPIQADLTAFAVYRYIQNAMRKSDIRDPLMLIHWNRGGLYVSVFDNHEIMFTRHIKVPNWTPSTVDIMLQDCVMAISRVVGFYHRGLDLDQESIQTIVLSGDLPYMPNVIDLLSEAIPNIKVKTLPAPDKQDQLVGAISIEKPVTESTNRIVLEKPQDKAFWVDRYADVFGLLLTPDLKKAPGKSWQETVGIPAKPKTLTIDPDENKMPTINLITK